MKMNLLLSLFALGLWMQCSGPTESAGGAGGTETTNGIAGILQDADGQPEKNIEVTLRSLDYRPDFDSLQTKKASPGLKQMVMTDDKGFYEFIVEDTGSFNIEAFGSGSGGIKIPLYKPDDRPISLGKHRLDNTGAIKGPVTFATGEVQGAIVYLLGTDHYEILSDGSKAFNLQNIPSGDYEVMTWGTDFHRDTVIAAATLDADETLTLDTVFLKLNILMITGINNHDGGRLTGIHKTILETSPLFSVTVSTTPERNAPEQEWADWSPDFDSYDAVILNYNNGPNESGYWLAQTEDDFEEYMQGGGGLVITHGSHQAFYDWEAYNRMMGIGWRDANLWPGLYIDSLGMLDTLLTGEGRAPHAAVDTFAINAFDGNHPINQGLPATWLHARDEIDFGLRGIIADVNILNYTLNPTSGLNEPVDWTVNYFEGRVYTSMLGHIFTETALEGVQCAGFQTLLQRGVEWAATGGVTQSVPADMPTETQTRLRDNIPEQVLLNRAGE